MRRPSSGPSQVGIITPDWPTGSHRAIAPPPTIAEAPGAGLPLLLPPDLRLSPEQFARVCEANPEAVLELAADGQLIAITPTGGDTSARNSLLITRLQIWALAQGGWSAGGPSAPNSAAASRRSALIW